MYQIIKEGKVNIQHFTSEFDTVGIEKDYIVASKNGVTKRNESMELAVLRCFVEAKLGSEVTFDNKSALPKQPKKMSS